MSKRIQLVISLLICIGATINSASAKTFEATQQQIDLTNPETKEPLKLFVWHPKGESARCQSAQICLPQEGNYQHAVILSHGAMGSVREMNWLGYALASQGIVTVGVNHFGESYIYGADTVKPERVIDIWRRPTEVSTSLDLLTNNQINGQPLFNLDVNWANTTAIGFSSGGATVLSLAGMTVDPRLAFSYCQSDKSKADLSCSYIRDMPLPAHPPKGSLQSFQDNRIKRIIPLDPALGHITHKPSLLKIAIPTLLVGAKNNDFLPFEQHAGFYAEHIQQAQLVTLDKGEGHFVFLDKCQHQYKAQGVSLCEDRDGVDRGQVQQDLYPHIFEFIYSNI